MTYNGLPEVPGRDVQCPVCNMPEGVWCRTRGGGSLDYLGSHKLRIKLSQANAALMALAGATVDPRDDYDRSAGY